MKTCGHRNCRALMEMLESRVLLSGDPFQAQLDELFGASHRKQAGPTVTHPTAVVPSKGVKPNASGTTAPVGLTPALIKSAYGVNQIMFGAVQGDGSGQTIAIIDGYHFPTALHDVNAFSDQFGLPRFNNGAGSPTFTQVNQSGGAPDSLAVDPVGPGTSSWETEEALDIEWTHAIAPKANLILVECYDFNTSTSAYELTLNDLIHVSSAPLSGGVDWARNQPGVSAISMSFGTTGSESDLRAWDTYLTTPAGHTGVTFLASTGDNGQPGGWPAYSPNVVAVGGTTLRSNGGDYVNETGWSGSGGGMSAYEASPSYQTGLGYVRRATPDVAMLADPNTGVAVYDTYDFGTSTGWFNGTFGGTSLAAPMWAGLTVIADQGRANVSLGTLDGLTQTLPTLYSLPASEFHDVISGSNGTSATTGYDLVTGRGTPIANRVVQDLVGTGSIAGNVFVDNNSDGVKNGADASITGVNVFLDANGNGSLDAGGATSITNSTTVAIPDNNLYGAESKITVAGTSGFITDVNVTLSITHNRDSNLTVYLEGPDNTVVRLLSLNGGSGHGFTNTKFDDSAAGTISGSAPFTGTFKPSGPGTLAAFNGLTANGTWRLVAVDSVSSNTGSITSWKLDITRGAETSTASDGSGNYAFTNLPLGAIYTVRQIVPLNYVQTAPVVGSSVTVNAASTNYNFTDFPTVFSTSAANVTYGLSLDAATHSKLQITAGAASYVVALALLPQLTFSLTGSGDVLAVDFTNSVGGVMLPSGGIQFTGNGTQELQVTGQSAGQVFAMSDQQINPGTALLPVGGAAIFYSNIATMTLATMTVNYSGSFATLSNLNIAANTTFNWI